jgi:histidine ammonia-lyase
MVLTTATASLLEITSTASATGHWLPVDSVEDHVSNATLAARRARDVVTAGWLILAAEAVALSHLLPSPATSAAARWLRCHIEGVGGGVRIDRPLGGTLAALATALASDGVPGGG